jgi:hypothetical protein
MVYRASRGRKQAKKGVQLTIMVVGEYLSLLRRVLRTRRAPATGRRTVLPSIVSMMGGGE